MKQTILVVDDDDSVRDSLKRVLEQAGYGVVMAASGSDPALRSNPQPVDLLLLDLSLPDGNGWDVFERMTTRHPLVPVIIITGVPNQYRTALAAGAGALFEKPLEVSALLKTIRALLDQSTEARLRRLCGYVKDTRHIPPASPPGTSGKLGASRSASASVPSRRRPLQREGVWT